jgi:uncharacterized protein (DUF1501 family)
MTVTGLDDLKLPYSTNQMLSASAKAAVKEPSEDALRLFTTRQVLSAFAAADQFQRQREAAANRSSIKYPESELASHLGLISQLLKSGSAARVFYTSQTGYDTHASQLFTHAQLLRDLSQAIKAFLDDLKSAGLEDRVVLLTFSEFGRRVKENDSQGTDHGAAAPLFVAGPKTAGGLVGTTPNLSDLDSGDVKMNVDLREVYAAILEDWLGLHASNVLGGGFTKAKIFRT